MGGGAQELTGPDFAKGIPFSDLKADKPVLGHANGEAVMVIRVGDAVHALGATCTHYGGPLSEGLIVGETVRCPWHHACFELRTGRAHGAPALADVACYEVARAGDLVQVRAKKDAPPLTARHEPKSVVIVGAGAAGAACVEMLRKEGYRGSIAMFGAEEPGPVDRPNLSKDYLAGNAPEEWIPLGTRERYTELGVDLAPTDAITTIDTAKRTVTTTSGKTLTYGAMLYATGAEPSRLPIDGANLPHVFTLRTFGDSRAIVERAKSSKRAVVIGASFIGLEAAASLVTRGLEVHVVAPDKVPLGKILGDEVGAFVRGIHEAKGTRFHLGTTPRAIRADAVELADGTTIACDLVVMGVGVKPRVALAERAGLAVDNGVLVDDSLATSAPGVWAAGDSARNRHSHRIEHWVVAERGGQHVAREMLRDPSAPPRPFRDVPFFWSAHHDVTISYVGTIAPPPSAIEINGSLAKRDAAVSYKGPDGKTLAVATINRDAVGLAVEAAMERGDYDWVDKIVRA
jgi:NADPH-dependent 2,4-dienoyl-CoA reductase/sulfur reductase-like enzyme/nitrite reductase/ring-hydroxylating ferredoxin subunit